MGNALNSIIRMHKKLPPIIQGYPALDLHAVGQHTVEHLTGDLVNLHVIFSIAARKEAFAATHLPGDLGLGLVVLCIQLILLVALLSLDHLGHFHAGVLQLVSPAGPWMEPRGYVYAGPAGPVSGESSGRYIHAFNLMAGTRSQLFHNACKNIHEQSCIQGFHSQRKEYGKEA
eukprot:943631-Pelagomonas_calceolata.AAC.4